MQQTAAYNVVRYRVKVMRPHYCATAATASRAEPVVREVVTEILGRAGFTVFATGDLREAEQLARDCTPDLLLTNLYVPGSSGRAAAAALRSIYPAMRTLVVAGLPDEESVINAMTDNGLDFFPKPFRAD